MPVPPEYQGATEDFYKLLVAARDSAGLTNDQSGLHNGARGILEFYVRDLTVVR
jgi:hypothetical protein